MRQLVTRQTVVAGKGLAAVIETADVLALVRVRQSVPIQLSNFGKRLTATRKRALDIATFFFLFNFLGDHFLAGIARAGRLCFVGALHRGTA